MDVSPARPHQSLAGHVLADYQLLWPLGRGGMSVVYRARDLRSERLLAVKVLAAPGPGSEFARRFAQEAAIMARLQHPHILPIYAYGEQEGLAYLVMPYAPAGTLQERLRLGARPGDPEFDTDLALVQQLCAALACAHAQGVVHRDVKPSNVLLGAPGWALLGDFGLARLVEADRHLTRAGVTVGTPEYISPEQAEGRRGNDRSDLYAVGVILFEVLTGRVPYTAATSLGVLLDHLQAPVPRPSELCADLPPAWDAVIARALAKQPAARYASAAALEAAIQQAQRAGGGPAAAPAASSAEPSPAGRPWPGALLGLVRDRLRKR